MDWLRVIFNSKTTSGIDYQKSVLDLMTDAKFPDNDEGIQLNSIFEDFELSLKNKNLEVTHSLLKFRNQKTSLKIFKYYFYNSTKESSQTMEHHPKF
jgi:hypothetical protein